MKRFTLMASALMVATAAHIACADQTSANAKTTSSTNAVAVKAQTLCPVMGGPINKSQYVDYDGKRIYVCCGGCTGKIKKDPAKYVKQLESEGITLDKAEAPKAK
jgi:YHS domain-containing protein